MRIHLAKPSVKRLRSKLLVALIAVLLVTVDAYGFGWGKKAVNVVKSGLSAVGSVIVAPVGGFVDSVTAPTILNADRMKEIVAVANAAAKQRIAQQEKVFRNRLDQMDGSLGKRIEDIDRKFSNKIVQVDGVLTYRIEQLEIGRAHV